MPELPEVETIRRGIIPHLQDQKVAKVIVRNPNLRWPVPENLPRELKAQSIQSIERRGKYLLLQFLHGTLLIHLGMSGRLCVVSEQATVNKHDHIDMIFTNGKCLRYTDPRRFGAFLWTKSDPYQHPRLLNLGPEPLSQSFDDNYLWQQSRQRKVPVKTLIMNSHVVVGVGNIYASEALFIAKIHPLRPANTLTLKECTCLVQAIKQILRLAIKKGGTTLNDFTQADGKPGYFYLELSVYGRAGQPCYQCSKLLSSLRIAQRNTVFCSSCQC